MQIKKSLMRIFLALCLLINLPLRGQTQAIQQIPPQDLEIIKSFFQTLLREEGFGYTIYGTKPMSLVVYNKPRYFWDCDSYDAHFKREIDCWKKYHHLFPSKHFSFIFYEDEKSADMALINHSSFIQVVDQHRDDFEKILGRAITGKELLSNVVTTASNWDDLVNNHYLLMGLLLGYGKHNSWLFQRKWEVGDKKRSLKFTLNRRKTTPMPGYSSIEEELKDIKRRFHGYEETSLESSLMALPYFMTDHDSPESQALIEEYKKERKKILKNIQGDCFTQVIKALCQDD